MISESRFSQLDPHEPPGDGHGPGDESAAWADDPVARLGEQFSELKAYAWQRCAVQLDRVSLEVRRAVLLAAVGSLALLAAAAAVITAVVLLLSGASGGLAELLGGRLWLANLIVSGATLGSIGVVFAVSYAVWARASRRKAKEKYERRTREQRQRFGQGAADRATGAAHRSAGGTSHG